MIADNHTFICSQSIKLFEYCTSLDKGDVYCVILSQSSCSSLTISCGYYVPGKVFKLAACAMLAYHVTLAD